MGLAKASLEANVRYLAAAPGPARAFASTAISAGPIKTLAAAGIGGFSKILQFRREECAAAPQRHDRRGRQRRGVPAVSTLASAITGEITYADCGFSTVAAGLDDE